MNLDTDLLPCGVLLNLLKLVNPIMTLDWTMPRKSIDVLSNDDLRLQLQDFPSCHPDARTWPDAMSPAETDVDLRDREEIRS